MTNRKSLFGRVLLLASAALTAGLLGVSTPAWAQSEQRQRDLDRTIQERQQQRNQGAQQDRNAADQQLQRQELQRQLEQQQNRDRQRNQMRQENNRNLRQRGT